MFQQTITQRKETQAPASLPARSAFSPRGFGEQSPDQGHGAGHSFSRVSVLRPQARLTVNQPGDKYEQEADSVADQVLRMGAAKSVQREGTEEDEEQVQAKPLAGAISPLVQRASDEEDEDEEDRKPVQAKSLPGLLQRAPEEEDPNQASAPHATQASAPAPDANQSSAPAPDATQSQAEAQTPTAPGQEPEEEQVQAKALPGTPSSLQRDGGGEAHSADVSGVVSQGLSGGGQPLDTQTRAFMEPRFGHDFSQVRIHTDARASQSSEQIAARAYTVGGDIAFRSGEFSPGTGDGKRLLAHELTHVVQQNGAEPLTAFRQAETKTLPNWGSWPNGHNNSTMTLNPHAELWADGRHVQDDWYPGNPAGATASFGVPADTKRGEVKIVVDGWWHQNNMMGSNEDGKGSYMISAPFLVNDKHEVHFEGPIAHGDPGGNAAQMTGSGAASDNAPDGGSVTAQVAISSTDQATSGFGVTGGVQGGVKVVDVQGGAGYNFSKTTPTGNKLDGGYRAEVKIEKPKTETLGVSDAVYFGVNKHKIVQDKLQGASIQEIYNFINTQPDDVKKMIKDGTVEIAVQAHASKTGDMGHNIELSEKRRDEVVRLLKDIIGAHANLNPTGVGFIEATEKGENPEERRVDMSFTSQRTPAAGSGAPPAP